MMPMSGPNWALNAVLSWSNAVAAPHSSCRAGLDGTGQRGQVGDRQV